MQGGVHLCQTLGRTGPGEQAAWDMWGWPGGEGQGRQDGVPGWGRQEGQIMGTGHRCEPDPPPSFLLKTKSRKGRHAPEASSGRVRYTPRPPRAISVPDPHATRPQGRPPHSSASAPARRGSCSSAPRETRVHPPPTCSLHFLTDLVPRVAHLYKPSLQDTETLTRAEGCPGAPAPGYPALLHLVSSVSPSFFLEWFV